MTNAATVLVSIAFVIFALRQRRLRLADIDAAILDYRIALEFIRDEHADMPHEFAAIFMSGNRQAMEIKFPDFAPFYNASRIEYFREASE